MNPPSKKLRRSAGMSMIEVLAAVMLVSFGILGLLSLLAKATQAGVSTEDTLIILMIGAVAMIRSMSSAMVASGNFGFKRDMSNQGVRALAAVQDMMKTGALSADSARQNSNPALNYSASMLAVTPEGIPTALLTDTAFAAVGSGADITQADMGITVRYVVDRLCSASGPVSSSSCMLATTAAPVGGSGGAQLQDGKAETTSIVPQAVYRVTVRVTGPRNSQSFFQATLTI